MREIYLENIRLKEKLGPNPVGENVETFASTILERVEQLQREQNNIKAGIRDTRSNKVIIVISFVDTLKEIKSLLKEQSQSFDRVI